MPRGKKQFALIWWVGSKEYNVIPLSKINKKDQKIDCITKLVWTEGSKKQRLQAKVVAIGDDETTLYKIPLNDQGMITDASTKIFSREVISNQKETLNEKKLIEDFRKSNQRRLNTKIISDSPIFPVGDSYVQGKQLRTHFDDSMIAPTTGPTVTHQPKKSKVGDSNKLKRSHSVALGSGVSNSMSHHTVQKKIEQSLQKQSSETYSSAINYDSHMTHQNQNRDEKNSQMRMNSLNHGGDHRDSFPNTIYPATPNSYDHPSPRPPFFPNYNPMGNYRANNWYHHTAQSSQQNNSNMWPAPAQSYSVVSCTSSYPPGHQLHHHAPETPSTGSENNNSQPTGFYVGLNPPSHPPGPSGMNCSHDQQYSWISEPRAPQNTVVKVTNVGFVAHQQEHSESEGISNQAGPSCPSDSPETTVLTLLTPKDPQSSIKQTSVEMAKICSSSTGPSDIQKLAPDTVSGAITTVPTEYHQDISANILPNYQMPINLVNQESPIKIAPDGQRREEMENLCQNQVEDRLMNQHDDDDELRSRGQPESFHQSPDDWRHASDDDNSYEEGASAGNEPAGAGDRDPDEQNESARAVANSYDAHINSMARAIAPYLPRPAPHGFVDYQRAVLLALELNGEGIYRARPQINVPSRSQSSEVPEQPLPEHYYKPGEDKEEVGQSSGFYMHKDKLSLANMMANKKGNFKWEEYVKVILDMIYNDDMANHCAQGKRNSGRAGICQRLLLGLYSKICSIVQRNGEVVDYSRYTYVINKRGSNKRAQRGNNSRQR